MSFFKCSSHISFTSNELCKKWTFSFSTAYVSESVIKHMHRCISLKTKIDWKTYTNMLNHKNALSSHGIGYTCCSVSFFWLQQNNDQIMFCKWIIHTTISGIMKYEILCVYAYMSLRASNFPEEKIKSFTSILIFIFYFWHLFAI